MAKNSFFYIGLIAVSAVWGINFGFSRLAMETYDPVLFAFLRFSLSIPFFFALLKWKEGSVGIPLKDALQLMVIGLVGVTMLEIGVMYSIKYTTLANASLLNVAPWPIFAALFAPLFTGERMTVRLITGGIVAMAGVTFVILGGGEGLDLSSSHMFGNLLALGVSLIGALYNLACMPIMKRYSALRVSTWFILFGSLFMFPFTLSSWHKVDWTGLNAGDYAIIGYNVLLATFAAFFIWNWAMYRVGAARANFFRYAVPATAVVAGYLMFGESISVWQIVGTVFMAIGLVWISLDRKTSDTALEEHSKPAEHAS